MVEYHITEAIPYTLSNSAASDLYALSGESYDVAVAGQPFFLATSDETPYRRVTAQYRKQQYDQTREAGEQSLTGWWFRSQSSFHLGQGIKYFEPAQDESLRFQYTESKGCNVWDKGQVTLLNSTIKAVTSSNTNISVVGVRDAANNIDAIVFTDGDKLRKLTMSGDTPTVTDYTLATGHTTQVFHSLTTDGTRYFAADTTGIHRGNIFGTTSDGTTYATGTANVVIKYAKQRLIAGVNNKLYELNATATPSGSHATIALPDNTPSAGEGKELYVNPNPSWLWTAIAEGPVAFYAAGYAGANSVIFKITLDPSTPNTLGFPELNVPTVTVELPEGEIVQAFDTYLGTYAVICTNKGVRVAVLSQDGDISYGPLLFEADCKGVTFKDRFAYVSTIVGGEGGLVRIDLSSPVIENSLVFAFAWDVYASGVATSASSTDFLGGTSREVFAIQGNGIYVASESVKVPSGYLQTGYVRYNTLEGKIFKLLQARVDTTSGGIDIESIDARGESYNIGSFNEGTIVPEVTIAYPTGALEYLGFKFTLTRDAADSTLGPLFTGYQLKSLPAVPRQRLIQLPVFCFDMESDSLGVQTGYEGRAYDRLILLESIENNGDTVRVQDFRTGEEFLCIIEELDFINLTPSDKRFSGYGGKLLVTVRTI